MKHKDLSEFIALAIKSTREELKQQPTASVRDIAYEELGISRVAWRFADALYKDDEAAKDAFFNATVDGVIKRPRKES